VLEVVGKDIISGNMGFIGTDSDRLYRMGAAEKTEDITVTGNPAVLDNATGKPFKDLHIYGRSEQMTTTGAQLLDLDALELRQKTGATIERLDDGGFLVNGTPESVYERYISTFTLDLEPGTYYISGGKYLTGCAVAQIKITNADGTKIYRNNIGFDVLGTEKEISITIQSTATDPIDNYKVYPMLNKGSIALPFEPYTGGKPSPSPDYPQEIQSAGDDGNLSVIVKNPDNEQMQSVSFSTPNGLPGIPVTSGGNYTDENGQQWICDEVDFGRGVYVQRVDKGAFDATKALTEQSVILATPIETTLAASEIAAYKSLRSYRGTTIVEAEDKAGISVTYKRNAKTSNISAEKKIEESEKKEYDES
jgi:hypothetical protein